MLACLPGQILLFCFLFGASSQIRGCLASSEAGGSWDHPGWRMARSVPAPPVRPEGSAAGTAAFPVQPETERDSAGHSDAPPCTFPLVCQPLEKVRAAPSPLHTPVVCPLPLLFASGHLP